MSVPTGQGQPTASPWDPPADAGGLPVRPARRRHTLLWVLLGAGLALFVLPVVVVVALVASSQHREHQPPQSLFDDASAVAAAIEHLSAGVPDGSTPGSPTEKPAYEPTDALPVRVSAGSVTIGNPAITPPTVVRLGSGNTATVTGTVGEFCVRVAHPGAQAMFYDSTWHAVQYGRGRSGACK